MISLSRLSISKDEDQILILEDGFISEYDYFDVMVNSVESNIVNYFKSKEDDITEF